MATRCALFISLVGWLLLLTALQTEGHPCQRSCSDDGEPKVCRYDWLVENYLVLSRACYNCPTNRTDCLRQQCVPADGFSRSIRTINRQLPGPAIQVCQGDTIEVKVINQMVMSEGLTIHWHGILQHLTPHMDGVSMVTQCPIPTFSKFTYRFLAEDPGTHLYHSHAGLYRGEGLFGSLVVRQPRSRDPQSKLYDHDLVEHEVVLNDWPHTPLTELYAKFFHSSHGSQAPDSILINGYGVYPPTREHLTKGSVTPLAEFHVREGQRYRFRVINAGALRCPIQLSVDHHSLLLIATDGHPIKPFSVASVLIFSGERYDFVLHATDPGQSGLHWVRAKGLDECESHQVQQFAILRYHDNSDVTVPSYPSDSMDYDFPLTTEGPNFNLWFLQPNVSETDEYTQISHMTAVEPDDDSLRQKADQQVLLEFAYRLRNNLHFHDPVLYPARGKGYKTVSSTMINNISNILPPAPLLSQPHDIDPALVCDQNTVLHKDCSKEFCECVHLVVVEEGQVVELVIYNSNNQYGYTHPLHLHGHSYRVVAVDRPEPKITRARFLEMDRKGLIHRRLHGAPYKDTLPIPNGGYLILRLKADNPGAWFMHCHVSLHAEIGMSITLQVKDTHGQMPPPPPDFPQCGTWPHPLSHNTKESLGSDQKASDTAGSEGDSGLVIALCSLAVINVMMVTASLVHYCRRHRLRTQSSRLHSLYHTKSVSIDRRESLSSEDEHSILLTH